MGFVACPLHLCESADADSSLTLNFATVNLEQKQKSIVREVKCSCYSRGMLLVWGFACKESQRSLVVVLLEITSAKKHHFQTVA